MTLGELLAWIDRSGSVVKVAAGRPVIALQPGWDLPPDVAAALRENRGFFLALGSGFSLLDTTPVSSNERAGDLPTLDPPYGCGGCGRNVHCADPAVVWQDCGRVQCPFWQASFGPRWMDSARWWWEKRAAERRAADRSADEGIPE